MGKKNKRRKLKRERLPFRLNILFFVMFIMFSALVLQLGVVQILKGESFQEEIDRTIRDTTKVPVPRGEVYDSNHRLVVTNKPLYAITYTPAKRVQAKNRLTVAKKLAQLISFDSKGISERNKKEYWYLENKKEAVKLLSTEEKKELDDTEEYNLILERIPKDKISDFTKNEQKIIAIKRELDKAYALTPQIVKNEGVTSEEYAMVSEHLSELPGINATADWEREYPFGDTFQNLIGNITTQKKGIPAEKEEYFLTRGYSRNDRVGISGLEEYYENVLRGRKEQIQYTTKKDGTIVGSETVVEGEAGKDLVLTIDMEFQKKVDKVVKDELKNIIQANPYQHPYLTDAIAVVMNPKTGELLAVSAASRDKEKNEYVNESYRALYDSHLPGSAVKGATVLAGYESGVISPGQSFYDRKLKIKGDPKRRGSYRNLGAVNDYDALRLSSNVYMFYIALKMGGEQRNPLPDEAKITFNPDAWEEMRNYFQQFGLGASTGIDYPYESTGLTGENSTMGGLFMNLAIGQYDTYTALQMAQYVSTIANDGYRIRPHFVKEIRNPSNSSEELGSVYRNIDTKILNRVDMDQSYITRIQEGFHRVFHAAGGTGVKYFGNNEYSKYNAAGKTGTAENAYYIDGKKLADTENLSLVGYAPYDDPEMAFAIIVPHTGKIKGRYPINHRIGQGILDAYFETYKP
ncbi:MAG: peptidoglycan D,D-transpeptidase FtsI family protein [Bacillota bacterium]|uniref:peptidoglycan D,D-transpeptidase FtsI family protein n=1 Tax=unclassified Virgibacillus TaxID=2620237 RepID=UPI000EF4E99C|nr:MULTISPECIES: penicillin-binding protein 2 [unclassified Virgibacillus]MCC2251818.1 penicillin-binding protein 2 [Virgibacillus sp. AGTR]QRZ16298.1 penicillin-binding protein 2 [Virgibacillus sp. AGTR]